MTRILICGAALLVGAIAALAALADSKNPSTKKPVPLNITDKTLVAWVSLANTTQRAGSVITLFDDQERFDAIVFAEKEPRKWMAGSDHFHRTGGNQSAYPVETADEKTLVQMAIAYRGKEITIYRNGKQYARYEIGQPRSFTTNATVLLGLRYVGHMGEIGFLAGTIEEARIYDVALDAKTIAALKPNQPSKPKPIGLWTFEDGTAADAMKNFPKGELRGGARIAGGKLFLDGKRAYVEIYRPRPVVVQSMFYKARLRETGNMWDTWLYHHKGTYYLYYLAKSGGKWDNISMAKSSDGVHWREIGRVLAKGEGVTWMGTGSTWKSPNFATDGKFFMNFSEWKGPRQTIFFAESKDLVKWTRLGGEYEFKQDERWYKAKGRWDCIWTIPRPGGGLYGYWTATPKPETGGRFGFGETLDGVKWKALAPPKVHGVGGGEVGAIEKIGPMYYMMFGNHGRMVTLTAARPEGPFNKAKKNFYLLSGHTYFSRFFPSPDGMLANHHSIARNGQVYFAPLKQAMLYLTDGDTKVAPVTLRLSWWKGNEKMKHDPVEVKPPATGKGGAETIEMLGNTFDVEKGLILEGTLALPKAGDPPRGLYVEYGKERGSAILIDGRGGAQLGPMKADGTGFKAEKKVDREMTFAKSAGFRLLLRHSLLEFYLDDVLIECFSLPARATGRVGLMHGGYGGSIKNLKAWR